MTPHSLTDLIERVEAASRPDRELDCRIWCAVGGHDFDLYRAVVSDLGQWRALPYTASLDAAMTLVPDGWAIERWQIWPGEPSTLDLLETQRCGDQWVRSGWLGKVDATAATPALALCAAALKARSHNHGS